MLRVGIITVMTAVAYLTTAAQSGESGAEVAPSKPESMIELVVVDPDGDPLPDIEWTARNDSEPVVTNAEGRAYLDRGRIRHLDLVTEDWFVLAPKTRTDRGIDLKYMPPPLRVTLGKAGSFEFRTHYPNGELAPVSARIGEHYLREQTTYTPDGFILNRMPPGPLSLTLTTNGGFCRSIEVVVPAGGSDVMAVEVPEPTATVAGVVRDTNDEPQAGILIWMHGIDYREAETTAEDGVFEFNLPPGTYALRALRGRLSCLSGTYGKTITIETGTSTMTQNLTVTTDPAAESESDAVRPATLQLHVTDADGNALSGIPFTLTRRDKADLKLYGATDLYGFLTLSHVQPGTYTATIEPEDDWGVRREYEIPAEAGSSEAREITLDGTRVSGRINGLLDASNVEVEIWNLAAGTRLCTRATPDGLFELTGVPQGFSTLRYHYDGMGLDRREPIVINEHMRPLNLNLSGGRIEGSLPRMAQSMMHDGVFRVLKLGPNGGYQSVNSNGNTFVADLLEDGDYEAQFEVDRKVVARSEVLTLKNGIAIANVTLEIDTAQLPNTRESALLRRRLEHQSSGSK